MPMVEVRHVSKMYEGRLAVDDLTFAVEKGEILGFLGPNGAGKSTTMRMLTGFLQPTQGDIYIGGENLKASALKAKSLLGYLPEVPPLYPELSVQRQLEFVGRLKGLSGPTLKHEIDRVCAATHLTEVTPRLIEHLSKGFRQRVALAQALLGHPPLLILDEPTEGLDPKERADMLELVKSLAPQQTIIWSTHVLSEVKAICHRVLVMSKGRKVALASLEEMTRTRGSLEEAFFQLTQS